MARSSNSKFNTLPGTSLLTSHIYRFTPPYLMMMMFTPHMKSQVPSSSHLEMSSSVKTPWLGSSTALEVRYRGRLCLMVAFRRNALLLFPNGSHSNFYTCISPCMISPQEPINTMIIKMNYSHQENRFCTITTSIRLAISDRITCQYQSSPKRMSVLISPPALTGTVATTSPRCSRISMGKAWENKGAYMLGISVAVM